MDMHFARPRNGEFDGSEGKQSLHQSQGISRKFRFFLLLSVKYLVGFRGRVSTEEILSLYRVQNLTSNFSQVIMLIFILDREVR